MKIKSLHFIIATLVVASLLSGCGDKKQQSNSQQPAPSFPVITVAPKNIVSYQEYPTKIEGEVNSEVRPKVSGYIQKVLVDEGQKVKQGQLLFKLETQSLSQDALAAKASVNAAQVEVDKLIPLVEKNIISNAQLETAKANLQKAKSSYNSINANIDYANVKSPVNGLVGSINFRKGSLVGSQNALPITTVSSIENVFAHFSLNEKAYLDFVSGLDKKSMSENIKDLPKVKLRLANGKMYDKEGTIETISGSIDEQTGTVTFRAKFDNANGILRNGSSGTILVENSFENSIVIPAESSIEKQGKTVVYQVKNDSLVSTIVTVAENTGKLYVIENGLKQGDVILAKGVSKVSPGMKITPVPTPLDSIINSFQTVFK